MNGTAEVVDHYLRTALSERQCVTAAQSVTRTGNDNYLAFKV